MNKKKSKKIFENVDLQWFAENDDTVLTDPEIQEDPPKKPVTSGFSSLAPIENVEILDEGLEEFKEKDKESPKEEGPSKEEILRNLQEKEDELEKVKENAKLAEAFDRLGDRLTAPPEEAKQQKQMTPEQLAEIQKKIDKELYDHGFSKTADKYFSTKIAPFLQSFAATTLADRKEIAQLKFPEYFQKYGEEIDAEVKKIPEQQRYSDPDVYKKAAQKVRANHLDEIAEEMAQKKVESLVEQKLAELGVTGQPKQKAAVGYSQVGKNSPPKVGPRRYLTPQEKEVADRKGITHDVALRLKYDFWD